MKFNQWLFAAAIAIILIYLSPLLILGEDAHVRIHDSLDSNMVWYKILAESGQAFAASGADIPNMMNGLPRIAYGSEFKLYVLLFSLFTPMTAFIINAVIIRFTAFFGMYMLLKNHMLKNPNPLIVTGVALCFSLLPFWPFGALSTAGIPLALYAFLNIRRHNSNVSDWLILGLMPFYSSFILTFIFFLGLMGILWLVDGIRNKDMNWTMFLAIVMMTAIYLGKLYRLVIGVLFGHAFTDHRAEFSLGHNSLSDTLSLFIENFTTAHTHAYTLQQYIIIYVVGGALLLVLFSKYKQRSLRLKADQNHLLLLLLVLAAAFSFWYALWYWEGMRVLKNVSDLLNTFNFSRIHFLNQVLWYLMFALALTIIHTKFKVGKIIVSVLLIGQLLVVCNQNHELKYRSVDYPSFEQFYSEDLFSNIQDYIGKNPENYRVASIGMHPAIALYNGFYTLDGYITMYPLSYKHQFRDVIDGELDKDATLQHYYDTWGSRCYIFVDELGKHYMYTKDKHKVVKHLDIDTPQFKKMGGDYILSAVKIKNAKAENLKLLKVFENDQSVWRIRLYKVL
ncbi:DUF6044 family protein [Tuberibacillus sp. Marseille-P3662]|uniref:DUF6044 family protein n=1 Tax=Tuberibacillus sp. Marseille-P3662 TaxID=1965358 RepID=UPI000A1CC340|nr:DUF6044 family protein [Tuberibacillus sp. Marseille-P3662]